MSGCSCPSNLHNEGCLSQPSLPFPFTTPPYSVPLPPGHTLIGTCSLCSGPVCVPTVWMGIGTPTATCAKCGAQAVADYGPIIPMRSRHSKQHELVLGVP